MIKQHGYYVYTLEEKRELAAIVRAADEKSDVDYDAPYITPRKTGR